MLNVVWVASLFILWKADSLGTKEKLRNGAASGVRSLLDYFLKMSVHSIRLTCIFCSKNVADEAGLEA